ncbi:MAG: hypothetical protein LBM75_01755 [Myxococcales bacterium]|jgi:hypothetical protein|nr:hypothetical protein [Myxococcales bacterium]
MIRSRFSAALCSVAVALCLAVSACANDTGESFTKLSASLEAELIQHADEMTEDGFFRLESGVEIKITEARLTVSAVDLIVAGKDASSTVFDPANPPAGYSSCHGGHCHADDGRLVDYADIQAELDSASDAEPAVAMTLEFDAAIDLLHPEEIVPTCESANSKSCSLSEGTLRRVDLKVSQLTIQGQVRKSGERAARAVEVVIPIPEEDGLFMQVLDMKVGKGGEKSLELDMHLKISAEILAAYDFDAASPDLEPVLHELSESVFSIGAESDHDHEDHADHDHG